MKLKIFTDNPGKLPGAQLVSDVFQADISVLFSPSSVRSTNGKPVYLVARRLPPDLDAHKVKIVSLDELAKLVEGVAPVKPEAVVKPVIDTGPIQGVFVPFSPGTNVGKTFISANMAAWLASHGRKTVLLDLDKEGSATWERLFMRDLIGYSDLTLSDWDGEPDRLESMVKRYEHPNIQGMSVLTRGPIAGAAEVRQALKVLAGMGYMVIVDTSNDEGIAHISAALKAAQTIFLVGQPTKKIQKRFSEMYANANFLGQNVVLTVNRIGHQDCDIKTQDFVRQFMAKHRYMVKENQKAVKVADKKKTLPVMVDSPLSKELRALFEAEFSEVCESKPVKRGLFGRNKK